MLVPILIMKNKAIQFWINHNLQNYLKKNTLDSKEINQILSWLGSSAGFKYHRQIHKLSVKDALTISLKQKKEEDEYKDKEQVDEIYKYPGEFSWVLLKNDYAYKRDAEVLKSCLKDYIGKDTEIYALRKNNRTIVNLEYDPARNLITQIEGFKNKQIEPQFYNYIYDIIFYKKRWENVEFSEKALLKINLHQDKNQLFSWNNCPEIIEYAHTTIISHLYKKSEKLANTIIVNGDLYFDNNENINRIADRLIVSGTVFISSCSSLKQIALDLKCKELSIKDCPYLKE